MRPIRSPPVLNSLTPKRLFIVGIVAALAISYLGSARGYLAQRQELGKQHAALGAMRAERDAIRARLKSLDNPAVVEARARELGYAKLGELPLRVTDLELTPPARVVRRPDDGFWDFLPDLF
jgi:cell division protein FtsB